MTPFSRSQGRKPILFAGHHALANQGENLLPGGTRLPSFNPLTGNNELNGTSIVDVSDPRHPTYLYHLPVSDGVNGGAQMVRVCDGSSLPIHDNKVYMLRTYANSAHEIWDVTDPSKPVGVRTVAGGNPVFGAQTNTPGALAGTHKSWWECDTGIAYIVGRRGNDTADGWGSGRYVHAVILGSEERQPLLNEDIPLSVDLPAEALKLAWWQVSCLQAVNDRFQSVAVTAGQIGNDRKPPNPAGPHAVAKGRLWGMKSGSRRQD